MNGHDRIRLGTRSSALARWQADWVTARLSEAGIEVELVLISTQGDVRRGPIGSIGGQGVFTKEIQLALLDERIDLAVHSLKDLPTEPVNGLSLAAVPARASCSDAFVSVSIRSFSTLPLGARVGTGSMRRRAQLLFRRPDLQVLDIRGNVETRLRRLDEGQYDAIILAEAGLQRLGLQHKITEVLSREIMLPAVGQGALGLEIRADDSSTAKRIGLLNDLKTYHAVTAERALLAGLSGGCLAPIGAWARIDGEELTLDAVVLNPNGTTRLTTAVQGAPANAAALGQNAADSLLQQGAANLIEEGRS